MPTYRFFADGCETEAVAVVVAKTVKRARVLAKEALGKEAGKNLTPALTYREEEEEVVYYNTGELTIIRGDSS